MLSDNPGSRRIFCTNCRFSFTQTEFHGPANEWMALLHPMAPAHHSLSWVKSRYRNAIARAHVTGKTGFCLRCCGTEAPLGLRLTSEGSLLTS